MTSLLCMLREATIKIKPLHRLRGDIFLKDEILFSHLALGKAKKNISTKKEQHLCFMSLNKSTCYFHHDDVEVVFFTHLSLGIWWLGLW